MKKFFAFITIFYFAVWFPFTAAYFGSIYINTQATFDTGFLGIYLISLYTHLLFPLMPVIITGTVVYLFVHSVLEKANKILVKNAPLLAALGICVLEKRRQRK